MKLNKLVFLTILFSGLIMQSCKKNDEPVLPNAFKINFLECTQGTYFLNQVEVDVHADVSYINNTEFDGSIRVDYAQFPDLDYNPPEFNWFDNDGHNELPPTNGATRSMNGEVCDASYSGLFSEKTIEIKVKLTAVFYTSKTTTEEISDEKTITVLLKPRN